MNYIDRRAVTSMTPTLVIQKDRCRVDDVTLAPEKSVFYRCNVDSICHVHTPVDGIVKEKLG